MRRQAGLFLGFVLVIVTSVGVAGAAGRSYAEAETDYRIYLVDGSVQVTSQRPLLAFGKVRFRGEKGYLAVPLGQVDLERSQAQWDRAESWIYLDKAKAQGRRFPKAIVEDRSGTSLTVAPKAGEYTYVHVWAAF